MNSQQEYVLNAVEEREISVVRLWFTDISGQLKSVMMSANELENAFEEGAGFDGSSIEGFSRISESDTLMLPDPSTFKVIPPQIDPFGIPTASMFCDVVMPDGQPSLADPRQVLRRQVVAAGDEGLNCMASPEIEFYLVKNTPPGEPLVPTDIGGYFDQAINQDAPAFRREMMNSLENMGIVTEFSHHETSPGQQEIDLRHADVMNMADNIMTFRYLASHLAVQSGVKATFMPKPFREYAGSALHTHFSLFEGENNAFHDPDDEFSLSATGRHFIAGILHHAHEICAVTNQWVNSYKRLQFGNEAPTAATWGVSNRSAMVRVPTYRLHKAESRRVEVRSMDSAVNPYLGFAVILAAGLRGIKEEYPLDPPAEDDVAGMTRRERRAMGYKDLPSSLDEALRIFERSEFMAEVLGEHIFEYFLRSKWDSWHSYTEQITPWELQHAHYF